MKSIIKTCGLVTLGCMLPLTAQVSQTTETTETSRGANGAVTETTTTTTFNSDTSAKVVTYFDSYKSNPHGLPPGYVQKVKVKQIPSAWRTARIAPGVVVSEAQRSYLVDAPPDLVKVLPTPSSGIRYYVAGSNVVAVDSSYKIVDSVQIPSIRYSDDGDEVEIESKEGNKTTKIEIDKSDGKVEIEKEVDE